MTAHLVSVLAAMAPMAEMAPVMAPMVAPAPAPMSVAAPELAPMMAPVPAPMAAAAPEMALMMAPSPAPMSMAAAVLAPTDAPVPAPVAAPAPELMAPAPAPVSEAAPEMAPAMASATAPMAPVSLPNTSSVHQKFCFEYHLQCPLTCLASLCGAACTACICMPHVQEQAPAPAPGMQPTSPGANESLQLSGITAAQFADKEQQYNHIIAQVWLPRPLLAQWCANSSHCWS